MYSFDIHNSPRQLLRQTSKVAIGPMLISNFEKFPTRQKSIVLWWSFFQWSRTPEGCQRWNLSKSNLVRAAPLTTLPGAFAVQNFGTTTVAADERLTRTNHHRPLLIRIMRRLAIDKAVVVMTGQELFGNNNGLRQRRCRGADSCRSTRP